MLKVLTLVARRPSVWTGEYGRHQTITPGEIFFGSALARSAGDYFLLSRMRAQHFDRRANF